jgi:hypothetical protein
MNRLSLQINAFSFVSKKDKCLFFFPLFYGPLTRLVGTETLGQQLSIPLLSFVIDI